MMLEPTVELVYDSDCPNVEPAREQLRHAFREAGVSHNWTEWNSADPNCPEHARGYGSPTILVNGRDVVGQEAGNLACCRLYETEHGLAGIPPVKAIVSALQQAGASNGTGRRSRVGMIVTAAPAVGVSLLPKVACPACWPAYAGFLSAIGLGFLLNNAYLLPLTAVFLAIAVGALAFRARTRRSFGPFCLGLGAAAVVLIGKFGFDSNVTMYGGLLVLVTASLWNSWPRKFQGASCSACQVTGSILDTRNEGKR